MGSFTENLKPYQRNLVASAAALMATVIIVGFLFGVFLLLKLFVGHFASVLWPLAAAGIIAMILRPLVAWLEKHSRLNRVQCISTIYLLGLLFLGVVLAIVLPLLFDQTVKFANKLPIIWENLRQATLARFPAIETFLGNMIGADRVEVYKTAIGSQIESSMALIPSAAQDVFSKVGKILSIGTGLAIIPVYLFFFLSSDRDVTSDLDQQLSFLKREWREDIVFLAREFVGSIEAFFRGQILIGFIIGVLLAIAFTVIGVNFGIGLGLLIGALNIIPYLGTIIGLGTVLPIAYFQPDGGLLIAGLALLSFIVVQMIEGYLLTPRIMGEKTGLHPLTIIIAIFFWGVALDGLLGMILAIPLTAFFVVAWRLAKLKYLRYFSGEEIDRPKGNSDAQDEREKADLDSADN